MKFAALQGLKGDKFRRLTGVKRDTFDKMVGILREKHKEKKMKGGRQNKLSIEEMLLMTLEYLREYRTYFHISQGYGVSESTAYKIIKWVEYTLIKDRDFALPGKKDLIKKDSQYEVILVDATESPIERPKKAKKSLLWEKEATYIKDASSGR
jgi:hypothetical protein